MKLLHIVALLSLPLFLFSKELPLACINSDLVECKFSFHEVNRSLIASNDFSFRQRNIVEVIDTMINYDVQRSISDLTSNILSLENINQATIDTFLALKKIPTIVQSDNMLFQESNQGLTLFVKGIKVSYANSVQRRIQLVTNSNYNRFIVGLDNNLYEWNPSDPYHFTSVTDAKFSEDSLIYALLNGVQYINLRGVSLQEVSVAYPIKNNEFLFEPSLRLMVGSTYNQDLNMLDTISAIKSANLEEEITTLLANSLIQQLQVAFDFSIFYKSSIEGLYIGLVSHNLNSPSFKTVKVNETIEFPIDTLIQVDYAWNPTLQSSTLLDLFASSTIVDDLKEQYIEQKLAWEPFKYLVLEGGMKYNIAYTQEGFIVETGVKVGVEKYFLQAQIQASLAHENVNPIFPSLPFFPSAGSFSIQGTIIW